MRRLRCLATALVLCPSVAFAAGFEVPENGALPVARGGSTSGLLDTAYAVAYNPAGLSLIDGLDVRLDYRFVNHDVSFTRVDETQDFEKVSNSAGIYAAPFVSIAYGTELKIGRVGFGAGAFGPAGVGKYNYTSPKDAKAETDNEREIDGRTGHRYATLGSDTLIMYPSVALSYSAPWGPSKSLSLGVTFQAVYADIGIRQSMAAGGIMPESNTNDVLIGINVKDTFTPTAILGILWEPNSNWRVNASFRPKVALEAEGTLDLEVAPLLASMVEIKGNKTAKLALALPPVARAGVAFDHELFTASADFVYEGWSVNEKFVLTPDVIVKMGDSEEALEAQDIEKHWKDSFGGRLGGTFKALRPATKGDLHVDVHLGGLFETNAIPSEYQSLDYVTGDRFGGSVGFTVGYKGFALTAGAVAYKPVKMTVTNSKVERSDALPSDEPVIIGNGEYASNAWVAAVGLSYSGFGSSK